MTYVRVEDGRPGIEPTAEVLHAVSGVFGVEARDHPLVLVGRLARLGCTRIGSPGIFG
jgi:hypothetical protein